MLHEKGLKYPKNVVETSSLPVILAVLQITNMIAVLPHQAVLPYCTAGMVTILPVELGVKMDAFGIITRRDHLLSPGAEVVLEALRETAARLYPLPSFVDSIA
jgi:DNA-binding transcriptional LysR family regulator